MRNVDITSTKGGASEASSSSEARLVVEVPPLFQEFIDPVIVRLRYLYPTSVFLASGSAIEVLNGTDADIPALARDINYLLYRERIFRETLPIRTLLYERLLSK